MKWFEKTYHQLKKKVTRHSDVIICVLLVLFSSLPRLILLDSIPPGLHGDEAWTGLDARRIILEGFIEPYVASAWGQPTGPLYLTAIVFVLLGESIASLRLSLSLFGIATIPLFYLFLRLFFSRASSILAASAFAFTLFHLHFSRIAFMLISAPFFQLLALYFLIKSIRSQKKIHFALLGAFLGLGIYTYNTFPTFILGVLLILLIELFFAKTKKKYLTGVLIFFSLFLTTAAPLLKIIITKSDFYFGHLKEFSSFKAYISPTASFFENAALITRQGAIKMHDLFIGFSPDYGDAFGTIYGIEYPYILFFLVGVFFILRKSKRVEWYLLLILFFTFIPLFTTVGGTFRRQILSLPLIFFPIALFFENVLKYKRDLFLLIFILIIYAQSVFNLYYYFFTYPKTPAAQSLFPEAETRVAIEVQRLYPDAPFVLWYSDVWSCRYESIRYLSSFKFCEDRNYKNSDSVDFYSSPTDNALFILTSQYISAIEKVVEKNPGGKIVEIRNDNAELVGIAYQL